MNGVATKRETLIAVDHFVNFCCTDSRVHGLFYRELENVCASNNMALSDLKLIVLERCADGVYTLEELRQMPEHARKALGIELLS